MALHQNFDPMKLWNQCKATALKLGKTQEQAEDFASFSVERVLKYQHFQPMKWMLSQFFGGIHKANGEEGYHERHCVKFEDFKAPDEDSASIDYLECLSVDVDFDEGIQKEQTARLRMHDIAKNCLERCQSAVTAKRSWALKKKLNQLNTPEVVDYVEHMEPLDVDWIIL